MAEYSTIDQNVLDRIRYAFRLPNADLKPIDGGMANSSFVLGMTHVITVLDNHDLTSAQILASTIEHVRASGIATPNVIRSNDGKAIFPFNGKLFMVKEYAAGTRADNVANLSIAKIGALNARINLVPPFSSISKYGRRIPKDWRQLLKNNVPEDLETAVNDALVLEANGLFDHGELCFTHGDLFLDNMVWDGSELIALDWETSTIDSALLDLGITLTALRSAKRQPYDYFISDLIEGYRSVRDCEFVARESVVLAAKYAATMLAFHRYYRQNILFPHPSRFEIYKELIEFWD
jgi:homoserine kinase type II